MYISEDVIDNLQTLSRIVVAQGFLFLTPCSKLVVGNSLLNYGVWFESRQGDVSMEIWCNG